MNPSGESTSVQTHWGIPLLRRRFPDADHVNPQLVELFQTHRAANDRSGGPVYASRDDVLMRYGNEAPVQRLFSFISDSIHEVAGALNAPIWQQTSSRKMQLSIVGAWFQIQNGRGFHEVHSHGNCSWCGVYYVQADPAPVRHAHPNLGASNGMTRFYGPALDWIGGAYMDAGNLYLQSTTFDSAPDPGTLVVFPSHLKHAALPYEGERDRIIVSFNAQVHGDQGDAAFDYSFS
jgi:uncharacterized protein (TIGR02466 family)